MKLPNAVEGRYYSLPPFVYHAELSRNCRRQIQRYRNLFVKKEIPMFAKPLMFVLIACLFFLAACAPAASSGVTTIQSDGSTSAAPANNGNLSNQSASSAPGAGSAAVRYAARCRTDHLRNAAYVYGRRVQVFDSLSFQFCFSHSIRCRSQRAYSAAGCSFHLHESPPRLPARPPNCRTLSCVFTTRLVKPR